MILALIENTVDLLRQSSEMCEDNTIKKAGHMACFIVA